MKTNYDPIQNLNSFLSTTQNFAERNKYVESEITLWIEAVLNDHIPPIDYENLFRDGVLLCRVMNTLKPGSVGEIQELCTKESQRANIQAFIEAARAYGVAEDKLFSVEDLNDKSGISKVTMTIIYLGKSVSISSQFFLRVCVIYCHMM